MADVVLNFLRETGIDIQYCRCQYKGVHQRIKCVCRYADYCPCCAHPLNLVGTFAVEANAEAAALFSLLQINVTFYNSSTKLWQ